MLGFKRAAVEVRHFALRRHTSEGGIKACHHIDQEESGALQIWDEVVFDPQCGYAAHPHQDVEIITYVRSGTITHDDGRGNKGRTSAGGVLVLSAGTGVNHSELNLENEPAALFQIWIKPNRTGSPPSCGSKSFSRAMKTGAWQALASGSGDDAEALPIRANARVLGVHLKAGESLTHVVGEGRRAYLVPAAGGLQVEGQLAFAGDGVALSTGEAAITALGDSDIVLVDCEQ